MVFKAKCGQTMGGYAKIYASMLDFPHLFFYKIFLKCCISEQ